MTQDFKVTTFDATYSQRLASGEMLLGGSGGSNSGYLGGDVVGGPGSTTVVELRNIVSLASNMGDNTLGTVLTTIQSSPWIAAFAAPSNTGTSTGSNFLTKNNGGADTLFAHGSMGATETFNPWDGNVHTGTLNAACTFTLTAPSGSGACTLELRLAQDGTGGWAITWPGSVTLVGTLDTTASTTAIIILETLDGGTSWIAVVVGASSTLTVKDEGTPLATFATSLDFVGAGVVASGAGAAKTITVSEPDNATHLANATDAHDASAISIVDAGGYYTGTDVEAALQEVPTIATTAAQAASGSHVHVMDCLFSGDGTTTAFPLPVAPFDQYSVAAFVSGVLTEVTLSGTLWDTATFGSAPASATNNIRFDITADVV